MNKYQSDLKYETQTQTLVEKDNMNALRSRVFLNLTKNSLQTPVNTAHSLPLPTYASTVHNRHGAFWQYYSTNPPKSKQNLLRYPVLSLDETMPRFLKSVEPLLNQHDMEITQKEAEQFVKCDGMHLQKLLFKFAEPQQNWLAHLWLRIAYMQYREPVTVYSSPGMTFPLREPFGCVEDFAEYAATLVACMVKFKESVDKGEMPVVKMGKFELDNVQFERVFGTCRIPRPTEDTLEYHSQSKHIIVLHKNHFYKLPVYNNKDKPLHPEKIADLLCGIISAESENDKGVPFGILTLDTRDNWAAAYAELMKLNENQCSVKDIQTALFTLSLDEKVKTRPNNKFNTQAEQLIHGGGSRKNSGNRWMDKTIQVVVNPNGMSGFTYEHSPAEGQPIAMMVDYIVKNLENEKLHESSAKASSDCAEKLNLQTSKCLDIYLKDAKEKVDSLASSLAMNVLHYENYGKGFLKQQKLSPDSYIQMALQCAFYKVHSEPAAQYETAHLRIFTEGRTETIRSCSVESVALAKAMVEGKASATELAAMLRKAVDGHRQYTTLALNGRGVDRHLTGLKLMALQNDLPVPAFYKTPGWVKSTHFRVSTSQVNTPNLAFMCYGPPEHDAYACCYNPRENDMILSCASWRSHPDTSVQRFGKALVETLDQMQQLLCEAGPPQPKSKL